MMDDFTAAMLEKEGKYFSELETEIVEAPFVQVPASARSLVASRSEVVMRPASFFLREILRNLFVGPM